MINPWHKGRTNCKTQLWRKVPIHWKRASTQYSHHFFTIHALPVQRAAFRIISKHSVFECEFVRWNTTTTKELERVWKLLVGTGEEQRSLSVWNKFVGFFLLACLARERIGLKARWIGYHASFCREKKGTNEKSTLLHPKSVDGF